MALLEEFMVYVYLVAEARFYVLRLTIDGTEVHIEQVARAVHVERARRYAETLVVGSLVFGVSCACEHKEHVVASYLFFDALDE
jgi:hypothetical protein